ncbi:uncharacterized protein LOC115022817 isoform X2 [Cottoperca gobio]|uniref:Uncharacterized protein LOC115022679 isoform X2 n=1 Tax=Cottoperca gobio TaxID=56716 RepID=A0A6J2RJS7_COTGO|nr:uncharacterized protein LOC115022679 isoform X2 [Cottoperca gobio]XP_029309774.1 uncharacterized protein LOC115022817 isoform X2 [Cottoperca gobio]
MGPEDYDVLKTAISNQGQRLGYQEHTLQTVVDQSRDITSTLATLCFQQTQAVAATSAQQPVAAQQAPHASPVSEPHIPPHPSILVTPTPACVLVESPLTAHLLVCSAPCPFPAVHGPTLPSISSRVYPCPKTNGQTERANQDLEAAFRCVTARNPSSWSSQLAWIEYAHNSVQRCNR